MGQEILLLAHRQFPVAELRMKIVDLRFQAFGARLVLRALALQGIELRLSFFERSLCDAELLQKSASVFGALLFVAFVILDGFFEIGLSAFYFVERCRLDLHLTPEIRDDLIPLRQLQSQAFALMAGIAHLLFQSLDLHVGGVRNRLSHCDAAASAHSVGKDSQGDGEQNARSERKPDVVPIDLRAPVSVSLGKGKASFDNLGHNTWSVRVLPRWRSRLQ